MKRTTIIFANGRLPLPLSVGGDGVSMHIFLSYLHKFGYPVISIGSTKPKKRPMTIEQMRQELMKQGIKKWSPSRHRSRGLEYFAPYRAVALPPSKILDKLESLVRDLKDVVIFTQLEMSPEISKWALSRKVPLVFFIHDAEPENFWTLDELIKSPKRVFLVFNSNFTQSKFLKYTKKLKGKVIYPPIKIAKKKFTPKNGPITMVNPVKVKGGEIFLEVVKKFPELDFLAIKVWYDPIKDGINFSGLKNVSVWEKQVDINTFLKITRLLLVPSLWEEGFGRIAAEAMSVGVPVMASKVGGLVEAVGGGGVLIDNYKNPIEWITKVKELSENEEKLNYYAYKGTMSVQKFDAGRVSTELKYVVSELVSK